MKVLVALDGSAPSLVARDLVGTLSWPEGTVVHVVAAYQVPVDWTGGIGSAMDWVGDLEDALRDQLQADLQTHAAPLVERGLAVEHHVVRGRPATVIIEVATEVGADLVVTGSRGRGQLRSMLLGSVASEVASHASCPVLVARAPSISRLLVATDGSRSANAIPERLAEWSIFRGSRGDVVAVSIPDTPTFELIVGLYTIGDERLAGKRRDLHDRYEADADAMAERLGEIGITATPHVRAGDPAREILTAADDFGSDLIVTGSRGLGTLERLLLGSVARNVLVHAGCSVLIVRTAADTDPTRKEI